ncbi:MAG TPA: response regulator transcription factor [Myxococcales bacterium]|nr:response regulator transcription factor [Myxococcales bacterium]
MESKSTNGYRNNVGCLKSGSHDFSGGSDQKHVLIANLDHRMAEFLRASLEKHSISVEIEADIFDAIFGDSEKKRDCVIMEANGAVMRELFESSAIEIPILAIVDESTVDARVRALDSGADDCLKSPFAISELVARIRALSRRPKRTSATEFDSHDLHDFEYIKDLKLVKRSDRNVSLTHTEDVILGLLLQSIGNVLDSSELAFRVWGSRGGDKTNLVAVHVANLRRKIDRGHPYRLIHTARGRGYFVNTREKLNSIRSASMEKMAFR